MGIGWGCSAWEVGAAAAEVVGSENRHHRRPADGESPASSVTARLRAVPNPFNPSTEIHFELERVSGATLDLFDASGRRIRSFDLGNRRPGQGSVTWDGTDARRRGVASGTYFARLRTSGRTIGTVRLVLVE